MNTAVRNEVPEPGRSSPYEWNSRFVWQGDFRFIMKNLVLKDFRIRYRNMSLGVFWSLLNPSVMMLVMDVRFHEDFSFEDAEFPRFRSLRPGAVQFLHHRLDQRHHLHCR